MSTKTTTELIIQKEIILVWIKKNVTSTTLNYRLKLSDIYKKFIKDLKINEEKLSPLTFGSVFSMILEEQEIPFQKGLGANYYGIHVNDLKGKISIIDTISRVTGRKFDFDIINEKNIRKWLQDCVIVQPKKISNTVFSTFISTNDLFLNFCEYYNLNLKPTRGNKVLFGKELATILKKYPHLYNLKSTKSPSTGRAGYLNIKELKKATNPNIKLNTQKKVQTPTYVSKTSIYLLFGVLFLLNLSLFSWILYNH